MPCQGKVTHLLHSINEPLLSSYLSREGVDDAGGLDADMDDALYCDDDVTRISEPAVWVVDDAAVWVGLNLVAVNEPLQR